MKLFTFQAQAKHAELVSGERFTASWSCIEPGWVPAYQWLSAAWQVRCGDIMHHAPVWCWQRLEAGMSRARCASELLSIAQQEAGFVIVELEVPDASVLLSSYSAWNEFLDSVIDKDRDDTERFNSGAGLRMFDADALKNRNDSVQAIIPYIEPTWIVSVRQMKLLAYKQGK